LYDGQYGFGPKFSTINAITDLTANILKSLIMRNIQWGCFWTSRRLLTLLIIKHY
jgi:hypothetical protein